MKEITIIEEIKKEIPPLTEEELTLLEASIRKDGVRDPLVLWARENDSVLIDGHNRYSIAKRINADFKTVSKEFDDMIDVKIWIRKNQLGRRNLTDGWKAELALRNKDDLIEKGLQNKKKAGEVTHGHRHQESGSGSLQLLSETDKSCKNEMFEEEAEEKPVYEPERQSAPEMLKKEIAKEETKQEQVEVKEPEPIQKHNTREEIANELGWSTGKVAKAEYVKKNNPDNWEKAKTGDFSIDKAYKETKKVERKKELQEERNKIAEKALMVEKDERWNIFHGDVKTFETDKKYDFIITDPPYPKEFLSLYETLAIRSKEWLKDGGLLIAMCGQSYIDHIHEMMSKHLDYYWTACYLTPGQPTPLRQINVNTTWKPLLIYKKKGDKYKGKIFGDVFKSDGNDKDFHKWGQSISGMYDVISRICLEGQSILDPFCGAGTTGIAAIKHNCFFDGIELDVENVNISKGRLNDTTTK